MIKVDAGYPFCWFKRDTTRTTTCFGVPETLILPSLGFVLISVTDVSHEVQSEPRFDPLFVSRRVDLEAVGCVSGP